MSQEKSAEIIDLGAPRAVPTVAEPVGEFLANARRAAGFGHAAVADATKIKTSHLEAIEAGDFANLPAMPYAVGFVKVYADFLGLDAETVAARFKTEITTSNSLTEQETVETVSSGNSNSSGVLALAEASTGTKLVSLLGIFAIIIFGVWIIVQIAGAPSREAVNATQPERRVVLGTETVTAPRPMVSSGGTSEGASVTSSSETIGESQIASEASTGTPDNTEILTAPENSLAAPITAVTSVETPLVAPNNDPVVSEPIATVTVESQPSREQAIVDTSSFEPQTPPALLMRPSPELPPGPAPQRTLAPIEETAPLTREPIRAPVIIAAHLTRSIAPRYPAQCDRSAEAIEKVTVIFDVTAAGRTANPRVISTSNSCFDGAAIAAVGRWRFNPKTVDGAPRPDVGKRATLNFQR